MPTIAEILARELDKPLAHVQNVIDLLDQGNTIPFIARYRKELHGSMDDTALRTLEDRLSYLRNLDQRRQEVKNAIDGQGKLTQELSAAIDSAATLAEVEDLYRPYKQKRRTRATVAREKGLEPLALLLLDQGRDCPAPEEAARDYVDPEKGVETVVDALQGANDIVAELLSDDAAIRKTLRELLRRQGHLRSLAATEEDTVYRLYYDFDQPIAKLAGHQVLAINRGEKEGVLSVTVLLDRELGLMTLRRAVVRPGSRAMEFIKAACEDAYDRLIYPSLEREARSDLTDAACEGAIANFGLNLKPLLMQPPVKGHVHHGPGPRLCPRLQGGGHRRHRPGAGHRRGVPHLRPPPEAGGHRPAVPPGPPPRRHPHRHRQRHRQPGDRADGGGDDPGPGRRRQLYDGQRGRGLRILRQQAGGGGVPGV